MLVVKRDGKKEPVAFDKITARIKKLCYGFNPEHVDPVVVAQKVVTGVFDGVSTAQLDDLASETAAFLTTQHPDYGKLAARIAVSNMHKQTSKSFSETMYKLHGYINPKTGEHGPLISDELKGIIGDHEDQLNAAIVYDRDFEYDYFGFKTLEKSYLLKMGSEVRPNSPSPLALTSRPHLASAPAATPDFTCPPPSPSLILACALSRRLSRPLSRPLSLTTHHSTFTPLPLPLSPGGRAAAADADARGAWHPPARHRLGHRDVQPHEREVVHARLAHHVQRRHQDASDVELLPAHHAGTPPAPPAAACTARTPPARRPHAACTPPAHRFTPPAIA